MSEEQELREYYEGELDYLRRMGADFARRFEGIATRLALDPDGCHDPHVERLLEGVALLTSRIRRKIDDEFPEITDALLGLVYPLYQRPIPSLTIVQLLSRAGAGGTPAPATVPRGSELESRPVQRLACRFRTTYPVTLWPVEVADAQLASSGVVVRNMPGGTTALLDVVLRTTGGPAAPRFQVLATPPPAPPGADDRAAMAARLDADAGAHPLALDRLRFYLDGNGTAPYVIHELLMNHVLAVEILAETGTATEGPSFRLGPAALQQVGFAPDEAMLDDSTRSFPGYRLLQEYFALPQKFLFVELTGLGRLAAESFGTEIVVRFFLDREPPPSLVVDAGNFRLGCTPAINVFSLTTAPIALTHQRFEYPVVPDLSHPDDLEVYAVENVVSAGGLFEEPVEFRPFYALKHVYADSRAGSSPATRARAAYWWASRRLRLRPREATDAEGGPPAGAEAEPGDDGTQVWLAFVDSGFRPQLPTRSKITVTALCTNRDLPSKLTRAGVRLELSPSSPLPISGARCLTPPTESVSPPLGRGAQWRLISCLALNHMSLVGGPGALDALRELLVLHDFAARPGHRTAILQGLTEVRAAAATARAGAPVPAICRGVEIHLTFDESRFTVGSAFVLATVLDRFFAHYVSINSFTRLVAHSRGPERVIRQWPPRHGARPLV